MSRSSVEETRETKEEEKKQSKVTSETLAEQNRLTASCMISFI